MLSVTIGKNMGLKCREVHSMSWTNFLRRPDPNSGHTTSGGWLMLTCGLILITIGITRYCENKYHGNPAVIERGK